MAFDADRAVDEINATWTVRGLRRFVGGREWAPRLRGIVNRGAQLLDENEDLYGRLGREKTEEWLTDKLAAEEGEVGFIPMWVFAIILKVIVTVIIDWWLASKVAEEQS